MSYVGTLNGGKMYFGDPTPEMVDHSECINAISKKFRFSGNLMYDVNREANTFYSVLDHSILVKEILVLRGDYTAQDVVQALAHDFTEAYVSDLAAPIKKCCPSYREVEDGIWKKAIAPSLGLGQELSQRVKDADFMACWLECLKLGSEGLQDAFDESITYEPLRALMAEAQDLMDISHLCRVIEEGRNRTMAESVVLFTDREFLPSLKAYGRG